MADQIEVTQQHKELAKVSEALAHPTRIAVLDYILSQEVCLCKDITKRLPIVQSSVSQHIKKLKDAGLIYGEKHGTKTCYCGNQKNLLKYKSLINQFLDVNNWCCNDAQVR
jgi:DNA-binding transcriptional ArsR family regulator